MRTQRWQDLIGVFERRIESTTDARERETLFARMARTYDDKLGRPEDAVNAYGQVLELDPGNEAALRALDELFSRQKMHAKLAENLEAQLSLAASEDAQLALMLRLAGLRERDMGQVDVAIEGYRQILERAPTNEQAILALERIGADTKYELAVADLLEPLYRQLGEWQKLVNAHEVQVRQSEDPSRRVELLHQIARAYEDAGGDLDSAFATLARALKEDPSSEVTLEQLNRVARSTSRFADLAQVLERQASQVADVQLGTRLYTESAAVQENDLRNVDAAVALHRKVLEIDALNLPAAESLERLFRASERYQDLSPPCSSSPRS